MAIYNQPIRNFSRQENYLYINIFPKLVNALKKLFGFWINLIIEYLSWVKKP